MIAAPASGSGKTTVTLGLLRALAQRGQAVRGAKSGPDYIDPGFHQAACGAPSMNLDAWAMAPGYVAHLLGAHADLTVIEGAMGLFDGAADGRGSCGALAAAHGVPVVLVVDAARMAGSVRALVRGFMAEPGGPRIAGVVLNRVGSDRHGRILRQALAQPDLPPVLGALPRMETIAAPARHLGLVPAAEHPDLDAYLDAAAEAVARHIDLDALCALAAPIPGAAAAPIAPPAQRIAIAQDAAFCFLYPHLLHDWRAGGAELSFFSPLADEPPGPADLVYLPGGYPELHAGRLAAASRFAAGIRAAPRVYGECGGYMTLGRGLVDAGGTRHQMLGLLPLETSFAARKLHLGYRRVRGGGLDGPWAAHEFHYATTLRAEGPALFDAEDAEGTALPPMGLRQGAVTGSFAHLIAPMDIGPEQA